MPWFINWDDYKTNFEQEATRILGHPVTVGGSASASILPSPSLTFTDVRVGPAGAPPMMTVDRFEVTIELMPLLQGEIHVTAMRLERPTVRLAVDETGGIDWLHRPSASEGFNPDKVVLSGVTISDGTITYTDRRTGVSMEFPGVTASVDARSLAGPWRAEGSYRDGDTVVPFLLATGRRLDDGTIRLKADVSPSRWPADVSADGVMAIDTARGLTYSGTYVVSELVENVTGEALPEGESAASGWRSEGAFTLTGERLLIDKAILSHGPPDRPTSVAGSLELMFGSTPSFAASAEARQLDLDRAFGGGPTQPVEIADATDRLVGWLTQLPIPGIPGRIALDIPAIVVGGSVIQDVTFSASPEPGGWSVSGFRARLPGQATLLADGLVSTRPNAGFAGSARLAVAQPSTFAAWWRGGATEGAGRLLAAFDIAGNAEIAPGRISVENIAARIGDATIAGRFAWSDSPRAAGRHLGTDLRADRLDFAQLRALAELLVGRDLTDASVLADSYSVILAAEAFAFEDVRMTDVAVNAEYSDDVLKIVRFTIGNLGGASFKITGGRIDQPATNPHGELTAELEVESIDGLALVAGRLFPGSGILEWLGRTADVTTPAYVSARIVAPPEPGGTGYRVAIADGVAGATTFNVEIETSAARIANWRNEEAHLSVVLTSPDSAAVARQFGLAATPAADDAGAHIEVVANGIPGTGVDAVVIADFAGVTANASGVVIVTDDYAPRFSGDFGVSSPSLGSLVATAGLSIPGSSGNSSVELDGALDIGAGRAALTWSNAQIANRTVNGALTLEKAGESWRLDGDLSLDEVDVGWLMALGLGRSPLPTGDDGQPWSKEPFAAPGYGALNGKLTVAAERATLSDALAVSGAQFGIALQPQRIDLNLTSGHFAGGAVAGGVSIHNVDGNANITGQFTLNGASLETFSWRLGERSVATGIVDLSLNLEAIGRSPAGLISSLTGGGVVSVHDGEARYFDPTFAARQIIRASDLGQEFTDDALRISLAEQIGADELAFGEAGGAFTIAGGAVRLRGVSIAVPGRVAATGNAVVDLNTMAMESDWTLAFDPGDTKVQGIDPKIGVVFRGPLARPARVIDPLPFGSYLNTRREARILEIIAQEEADRLEREWFSRVALKLRQETEREARLAREAAEAERLHREIYAAAGLRLERLHIERENRAAQRLADDLERWSEKIAAASAAAAENARTASDLARSERERAIALADAIPALVAAESDTAGALETAQQGLAVAEAALSQAEATAASAAAYVSEAEAALQQASATERTEQSAAESAGAARLAAEAELAAATTAAEQASVAATEIGAGAAAASTELDHARRGLTDALTARDAARTALSEAEQALAQLEGNAQASGEKKAAAAREASSAMAERDRLRDEVDAATESANAAASTHDAARRGVLETESALRAAEAAYDDATQLAENAAAIAEALVTEAQADSSVDASAAQETARAMELRRAVRRAEVDRLRQELELARPRLQTAEAAVASAAARASMAKAALDAATAIAADASAIAEQAVMANATLVNMLSQRLAARDAAVGELAGRESDVAAAEVALRAAETGASEAAAQAAAARTAADAAEAARVAAANALAATIAEGEQHRTAAVAATAEREQAESRLAEARASLDAANLAAQAARAEVEAASAALDAATATARDTRAARVAAEEEAAAAQASAADAEAAAVAAVAAADRRAIEAEAAGYRLSPGGAIDGAVVATPTLRPRTRPINLVPEAVAGDEPMVIVPVQ